MTHAMIDVETLGTGTQAPIFEIGVCVFNLEEKRILGGRLIEVDLLDVILRTGFMPQKDTVAWWQTQEYQPSVGSRVGLVPALAQLDSLLRDNEVEWVWANSPSFDCVLLSAHYAAVGMTQPWKYSQELDFRTMKFLGMRDGRSTSRLGEKVTHNGLEDAERQTRILFDLIGEKAGV